MNVSSLISPEITKTLISTGLPSAFGDQVKETAKKKITSAALGQAQILQQKLEDIIKKKLELEKTHKLNLVKLDNQYQPKAPTKPVLTKEEYEVAVANEDARYAVEKEILDKQQQNIKTQIQSINKDPKIKIKAKEKLQKLKQNKKDIKNKSNKTKADKALLTSVVKSVAPLLMYSSVKIAAKLIVQNSSLQKLVNKTNDIIDAATTPDQLNQARATRNSAYNVLNNNEKDIIKIKDTLSLISTIISLLSALSKAVLASISTPATPASAYDIYKKISDNLNLLSSILMILLSILNPIISELEDLKNQLRLVDNKLDLETLTTLNLDALNLLLNDNKQPNEELYKGFKLVIKEDQNPRTTIDGSIKRHYGVALSKDGVEMIKSEYSYTLEPQILIDQLKIIIDQQNLQA